MKKIEVTMLVTDSLYAFFCDNLVFSGDEPGQLPGVHPLPDVEHYFNRSLCTFRTSSAGGVTFAYCAGLLYDGSAWAWLGEFLRCCYFSKKLVFTNLLIVMAPQTNIIVRPSKHSLPLQKLTNLTSEWKVGRF